FVSDLDPIRKQRPRPWLKRNLTELGLGREKRIRRFAHIGRKEAEIRGLIGPGHRKSRRTDFPETRWFAFNLTKINLAIRPARRRFGGRRRRAAALAAATSTSLSLPGILSSGPRGYGQCH